MPTDHRHPNRQARLVMFGQELNPESYAICKAGMLIKGQDIANIVFGNTLSNDGLPGKRFDYMLSSPPFGVEWKKIERVVRQEAEHKGFNGRFGRGLPRVSDGSLLFLLHLISKVPRSWTWHRHRRWRRVPAMAGRMQKFCRRPISSASRAPRARPI